MGFSARAISFQADVISSCDAVCVSVHRLALFPLDVVEAAVRMRYNVLNQQRLLTFSFICEFISAFKRAARFDIVAYCRLAVFHGFLTVASSNFNAQQTLGMIPCSLYFFLQVILNLALFCPLVFLVRVYL